MTERYTPPNTGEQKPQRAVSRAEFDRIKAYGGVLPGMLPQESAQQAPTARPVRTQVQPGMFPASYAAPQPQFARAPQQPYAPQPQFAAQSESQATPAPTMTAKEAARQARIAEKMLRKNSKSEKERIKLRMPGRKSLGVIALGGVIVAGTLTVGANGGFSTNNTADLDPDKVVSDLGGGMDILPLTELGTESLNSPECEQPNAGLIIVTVDGYWPMVPTLPEGPDQKVNKAPAWLNQEVQIDQGLESDQLSDIAPFNTESGYPQMEINQLPLYLNACSTSEGAVKIKGDGTIEINREAIRVTVKDANELFDRVDLIKAIRQEKKADVELDPQDNEYVSIPNKLFMGDREGDDGYNAALAALKTSLVDTDQLRTQSALMLALSQLDAVKQLASVFDGQENINYPDGVNKLQEAIDKAILKRIGGENSTIDWIGDDYTISMVVAKDEATKEPITSTNSLIGLSASESFTITNMDVVFGSPTEPDPPEIPKPTPTPTEETEPTP